MEPAPMANEKKNGHGCKNPSPAENNPPKTLARSSRNRTDMAKRFHKRNNKARVREGSKTELEEPNFGEIHY